VVDALVAESCRDLLGSQGDGVLPIWAGIGDWPALRLYPAWQGVMVPTGTPDDDVAKLNAIINKALADEKVSSWLAGVDYQNMKGIGVKEANAYLRSPFRNGEKS
jgi:hypothetical protein